jgi:hypothetical protein
MDMATLGRFLVFAGVVAIGAGLLLWWGVPLGRLPGDIVVRREGFSFHLPITTSILVSVVLTLLLALFRR